MYIVSTSEYVMGYTDFILPTLDHTGDLLLDEDFLSEYSVLFKEGITGFHYSGRENRDSPLRLAIQYWNGRAYEETSFYLFEVKVIGKGENNEKIIC